MIMFIFTNFWVSLVLWAYLSEDRRGSNHHSVRWVGRRLVGKLKPVSCWLPYSHHCQKSPQGLKPICPSRNPPTGCRWSTAMINARCTFALVQQSSRWVEINTQRIVSQDGSSHANTRLPHVLGRLHINTTKFPNMGSTSHPKSWATEVGSSQACPRAWPTRLINQQKCQD